LGLELLIATMGIVYAPLAPFLVIWVVVFFAIAYLVAKFMFVYVYKPEYDSGGKFWPIVFNRTIAGKKS
jgi:calcium permeable stress-gated cation channel